MKRTPRVKSKDVVQSLSTALKVSGLSMFMVGLSGCDVQDDCKDLKYAPQFKIDECTKKKVTGSGGGGSGSHSYIPMATNTGYFGSSDTGGSSTSRSGFSGSSGG